MHKVVLITGAGSNLGLALARRFFADGACVAVNDISKQAVSRAVKELSRTDSTRVIGVPGDIADARSVERMTAAVIKKFGRLDVLINNAAAKGFGHSFVDTPVRMLDAVLAVNVRGTFLVSQAAAKHMMRSQGVIISIGSTHGERALRNRSAYAASKGAIESLTRAMALDLAPRIRVNCVVPGYVRTDRWDTAPKRTRRLRENVIPLREPASFDDVAEMVMFLAGDKSKNITGARYLVDGGCSAQHLPACVDV